MFKAYPVQVTLAGRPYNGHWEREGGDVIVSSAYGSKRARVGRRDPEEVAVALFKTVLAERVTAG